VREAPVGVVLVGCGEREVQTLGAPAVRSERLRLLAVCDPDAARRAAAAQALGVEGVADYHELLGRREVQGVIVATGTPQNAPIAQDAVEAGKHVLIEKPLAESAATARRLVEAAARRRSVGMVGNPLPFTEFARVLKRTAAALDPIQALMTVQRGPMDARYFFPAHYGGVVDAAVHTIQLALWVMDRPPETVYGQLHRGSVRGRHDGTIEALTLVVEFEGGARSATVVSSMFAPQAANFVQVVGRRGHVSSADRASLRVVSYRGIGAGLDNVTGLAQNHVETAGEADGGSGAMLDHFAARIGGAATEPDGATLHDGLVAAAVTEALAEAAQTGRRVSLAGALA
jgi:predicted dehydrogenase